VGRLTSLSLLVSLALPLAGAARRDHRLADAVERRDIDRVDLLLRSGADVNGTQGDGATALHWAVYTDETSLVDRLLDAGANVNAANDHGVTPLALACESRNEAVIAALLRRGADPNASVSSGESALMTASRAGTVAGVKALLARGANVNVAEQSHGQTALMWAVSERHPDVVRLLIEAGADVRARSRVRRRTVQVANRYGDQNSVRGVTEMDLGGFTPLLFAVRNGDIQSARLLLAAGADVNDSTPSGVSALVLAAHSGQGRVAELLVERGADVHSADAGYTALHGAVLRGDRDLVRSLLARGADPSARLTRGTPSRYYSKDYAFNESLVGATPLWLAARYAEPEIMQALVAAGADPRVTAPDGSTMLTIVPTKGLGTFRVGDRRERYQGQADVAAKGDGEDEAITLDTARLALALGADINAADRAGDTALHLAASLGLTSVVRLLVERGARLETRNRRGQTALGAALAQAQLARGASAPYALPHEDSEAMAKLLRELGAKD
jgi:ankyrin repeat protein